MKEYLKDPSNAIKSICLYLSASFIIACPIAGLYTGEFASIFSDLSRIFTMPCPLITDYFALGSLAAAFLNAGLCGLLIVLLMYALRLEAGSSSLAGFFLVIAHCFYGLNLVNMLLPMGGILLYCAVKKQSFRDNFTIAMFSTAFGPFVSELLFRYTLGSSFSYDTVQMTLLGVILAVILCAALGFIIPAVLPATVRLHKGYNLYNAGLAFGLIGLFLYSLMYPTIGIAEPDTLIHTSEVYDSFNNSYSTFIGIYLVIMFASLFLTGMWLNNWELGSYKALLKESGYKTDLLNNHGTAAVIINISIYGTIMLVYLTLVTLLTEGVGYTGATLGVTFAALTFSAAGQHPRNVWPILAGYALLSLAVSGAHFVFNSNIPWTLSMQSYINSAAFATGLCPISGKYGRGAGIAAGITCAVIATSTSAFHGGLVLYNGGFAAGLAALMVIPILEFYSRKKASE